jgi:hypothetical protein
MIDDRGDGPEIKAEAASYVAELTADLARIARRHGLDTLGYILDMARLEAQSAAGQSASEGSEVN